MIETLFQRRRAMVSGTSILKDRHSIPSLPTLYPPHAVTEALGIQFPQVGNIQHTAVHRHIPFGN
jgi:hypothetical protein